MNLFPLLPGWGCVYFHMEYLGNPLKSFSPRFSSSYPFATDLRSIVGDILRTGIRNHSEEESRAANNNPCNNHVANRQPQSALLPRSNGSEKSNCIPIGYGALQEQTSNLHLKPKKLLSVLGWMVVVMMIRIFARKRISPAPFLVLIHLLGCALLQYR